MRYRIKDWSTHFEGSKSKGYNNKTVCSMPCKHGLGYSLLVKRGGAAAFGAWCALVQVLSRHRRPRDGWVTVDGTACGRPYQMTDLELITGIPAKTYATMLGIVSERDIAWVVECKDTTGDQTDTTGDHTDTTSADGAIYSDSDSDLNPDSNSTAPEGDECYRDLSASVRKLYNRRDTTPFSAKERKALKAVAERPDAIAEACEIEAYYTAMRNGPAKNNYARRDMFTLLNNWGGEVDRAKAQANKPQVPRNHI